jgi:hypothetical protein
MIEEAFSMPFFEAKTLLQERSAYPAISAFIKFLLEIIR